MAIKTEIVTREQIKKAILGCLKDIEKNIEPILDRLMGRCCKAYLQIFETLDYSVTADWHQ